MGGPSSAAYAPPSDISSHAHHQISLTRYRSHRPAFTCEWNHCTQLCLQIHNEAISAASYNCVTVFLTCLDDAPIILRYFSIDFATKPLQPTSTGSTSHIHPRSSHTSLSSSNRHNFLSYAHSIFPSHGTVSSTMITLFTTSDQIIKSGLCWMTAI